MALNTTLEKMHFLRLNGMADAFEEQLSNPAVSNLAFEERIGLLIDREKTHRENERLKRLLRQAKFKYPSACIEDIDYSAPRGLEKSLMADITNLTWLQRGVNLLIAGPTGTGKTWLACAIGNQACRRGHPTMFCRIPLLLNELNESRATGDFSKLLKKYARPELLILDDLGVGSIDSRARNDLLEVIESRSDSKSTIVTSQLPVESWHKFLGSGNKTVADAIMDRVVGGSLRLKLTGDSMRQSRSFS